MNQSDAFVARQPIFDRARRVTGYELLFRNGNVHSAVFPDGNAATRDVVGHTYLTIGLDRLTGGLPAFINFTRRHLVDETPGLLPSESTVVEILEHIAPEPEVLDALRSLKSKRYVLALDDVICCDGNEAFLDLVDIVKFDFAATTPEQRRRELSRIRNFCGDRVRLLAEKVEDYPQFRQACEAGFDLFQGYFFARPEVITGKVIPGHRLAQLRVLRALQEPSLDFRVLEDVIKSDLALTTRLLRFINSAAFPWAREITSLRQALVLLGEERVRRWVTLVIISEFTAGRPRELAVVSSVRGRLCERVSGLVSEARPLNAYLVGAFSLLDALLDVALEDALRNLPLQAEARDALAGADGPLRRILDLVIAYESGDWDKVARLAGLLQIPEEALSPLYVEALEWTRQLVDAAA